VSNEPAVLRTATDSKKSHRPIEEDDGITNPAHLRKIGRRKTGPAPDFNPKELRVIGK
jgi:hypothetical protein